MERDRLASAASGRNAGFVVGPHPPELQAIAERSLREYRELHFATGGAFLMDREESIGSLIVAEDHADLADAPGDVLTGAGLQEAEPQLADDLAGGYLIEARRIDPAAATMAWADEARCRYGSTIHVACEARGLLRRAGTVIGAITDQGQLLARHTVIAAGPWSWRLARETGLRRPGARCPRRRRGDPAGPVPAAPPDRGRGLGRHDAPARHGRRPRRGRGAGRLVTPRDLGQDDDGRMVIGASHRRAIGDGDKTPETLAAVCRRAIRFVPGLAGLEIAETRACQRPMTADGLPCTARSPAPGPLPVLRSQRAGRHLGPGATAAVAESLVSGEWDAGAVARPLRRGGAVTGRGGAG